MSVDVIACVLRTSPDYDIDYVEHLVKSIRENSTRNVEIVCTYIPLEKNLPGWWSKLELFSCPYLVNKTILYFDLDTVIQKSIDFLLERDYEFMMLEGFKLKKPASGMMAWSGNHSYITNQFSHSCIEEYSSNIYKWGDQAFITEYCRKRIEMFQHIFPDTIASYKYHDTKTKQNAHIVCFHGNPRPRKVNWKVC